MVLTPSLKRSPLQDFYSGQGAAADFFRASYLNKTDRISTIQAACGRMMKPAIVAELEKQNSGVSKEVDANLAKVKRGKVAVVVTGQQLGLLGGPLLTIYKIISAIKVARDFANETGSDVIPLFWMQSEDHDFEEIRSAIFLGTGEQQSSLSLDPGGYATGDSIGSIKLGEKWTSELDAFLESHGLASTDFAAVLKEGYKAGRSLSEAFGSVVRKVFGRFGLLVFDPQSACVKQEHRDFIASAFLRTRSINSVLDARAHRMEEQGYDIQVKIKENSPLFFLSDGKRRERLTEASDGTFSGLGRTWKKEEIFEIIDKQPERFTTSALIRPVFQDTIFPTAAYICGPAEFNYWTQLKPLYEFFNALQPLVIPRGSFVILEKKYTQLLSKTGITLADLLQPTKDIISKRFQNTKYDPDKLFAGLTSCFTDRLNQNSGLMLEIDQNLAKALEQTSQAVSHNIAKLKEKYERSLAAKEDVVASQIERLKRVVCPDEHDQERVFSWAQFMLLYGDRFVDAVLAAADPLNVREMVQVGIE